MTEHPDFLLVVRATIASDREAEWNRWYNDVHLPEILACPGFRSAARYVGGEADSRVYVTVYRLESPSAVQTAEFAARRGWSDFAPAVRASVVVFEKFIEQEGT